MKKLLKDREFLRLVAVIALPIAAQNLITFAIQMMDTVMLGAVGQTQLTAASLANSLFSFLRSSLLAWPAVPVSSMPSIGVKGKLNLFVL